MAIVERTWTARWIGKETPGPMPIFRRAFEIDRPITRAIVHLCGLGQHELRLNDRKVGEDLLEPGWTNYRKTCLYVSHDVTGQLRPGENVIEILLGNGMYSVTGKRYKKFKASFGPLKLICEVAIEFTDGSSTLIASGESWQAAPGPITFSCIYGGEDFDARLQRPTDWQPVDLVDPPGGTLIAQSAPPIRVMQTFRPAQITEPKLGTRVYDLGQNFSGWPSITARGSAGATITLTTGELLDEHGLVTQKNTGSPVSFSYTLNGQGDETWHPRFSYTGFRYVQADGDIDALIALEGHFVHSSAPRVGHFACSDEQFNRIHELIVNAIRSNLQSVITDCPHREKLGWLEQTHLMGDAILFNFDARSLYAKVSADMRDAQLDNGCVPTIAPQYTAFKPPWDIFNDSPEWGSACIINPWLIYKRFGDRAILQDNYQSMGRYFDYLSSRAVDGLLDYGLGDWYDIGPGDPGFAKNTSKALTASAIYYQDATILEQVARLLGHLQDADRYRIAAQRIRAAANTKLFNPTTRVYDTASQTALAMPLALGMLPPGDVDGYLILHAELVQRLIDDIRAHDNHITAGDVGFHYVIRALAGSPGVIFDLLARTDPPSYGAQLARGATTLTEAWDANPKNSQNHLMLGHAEIWFYEYLAGIRIDFSQPPDRRIVVAPKFLGDLTWAEASYQSALGPITSRWDRTGNGSGDRTRNAARDRVTLRVSIPPGASATIYAPCEQSNLTPVVVQAGLHQFEGNIPLR